MNAKMKKTPKYLKPDEPDEPCNLYFFFSKKREKIYIPMGLVLLYLSSRSVGQVGREVCGILLSERILGEAGVR